MGDYKFTFHEKHKEFNPAWLAPEGAFALMFSVNAGVGYNAVRKSSHVDVLLYSHAKGSSRDQQAQRGHVELCRVAMGTGDERGALC